MTAAEPIRPRRRLEREIQALAGSVGRRFGDLDRRRPLFSRLAVGRLGVKVAAFYVCPRSRACEERLRAAPTVPTREPAPTRPCPSSRPTPCRASTTSRRGHDPRPEGARRGDEREQVDGARIREQAAGSRREDWQGSRDRLLTGGVLQLPPPTTTRPSAGLGSCLLGAEPAATATGRPKKGPPCMAKHAGCIFGVVSEAHPRRRRPANGHTAPQASNGPLAPTSRTPDLRTGIRSG